VPPLRRGVIRLGNVPSQIHCGIPARYLLKLSFQGRIAHHQTHTYHQNFPKFYSFFNEIELFLCPGMCKQKGFKCSWRVRSKGATQRIHRKRMSDSLLQIFGKNSSRPLSSSSPISSSFLVGTWVQQPGLYKTSLYSKSKDAMTKDLKLEI
jgi:hypothetical protein